MRIRNKSHSILAVIDDEGTHMVRPMREIEVDNSAEYDVKSFELVSGETEKPAKNKEPVTGDLNGDGVFDAADKTLAAKTLRKKYK